jgi:hypothetical protein
VAEYINPKGWFTGAFIPNCLLERTEISASAKLVYARLVQHLDRGGVAYPHMETLAAEVGLQRRQIVNIVRELERQGLIDVTRRGFGKANEYRCLAHPWLESPNLQPVEQAPSANIALLEVQSIAHQEVQSAALLEVQSIAPYRRKGAFTRSSEKESRAPRVTSLDEEFLSRMMSRYADALSEEQVREEVTASMGHTSWSKWTDKQAYVNNWLRRSAAAIREKQSRSSNGHDTRKAAQELPIVSVPDWFGADASGSSRSESPTGR